MPKAMEKINTVEGFTGIPNHPMIPAVINRGNKFGMMATTTILGVLKSAAINKEITKIAKSKLTTRLLIKNLVERKKMILAPV